MALVGIRNGSKLGADSFAFTIPKVDAYQIRTTQSTRLWVPRTGDQCWAHELPCTPYVSLAALGRVRWPAAWPYRYDPRFAPPPGWLPLFGVFPRSK